MRALVAGFHDAWTAAGDDREPGVGEQSGDAFGEREVGVIARGTGAAKDAYRRRDVAETVGSLDEL